MAYQFEWDESKNKLNLKNHGIDFNDAQTVFFDSEALLIDDPDHSEQEDRFLMLGISSSLRLMVVCHCYREADGVIRIISARKAIKRERNQYTAKLR
jgi:uncharacterized DUF497 family protein